MEFTYCASKGQRVAREVCQKNLETWKCEETEEGCVIVKSQPEKKGGTAMGSDRMVDCPECGIPNTINRVTCQICHTKLRKEEGKMDETAKELYGMNKKLKQAMTAGDAKTIAKVKSQIKAAVAKSDGVFKVGENGLATQAKSTAAKPKAAKVPKKLHKCPCCGADVGGYFKMGHDGRVHGILIKIGLGKAKVTEFPKAIGAMYEIWKKDKSVSMKSVAMKIVD